MKYISKIILLLSLVMTTHLDANCSVESRTKQGNSVVMIDRIFPPQTPFKLPFTRTLSNTKYLFVVTELIII